MESTKIVDNREARTGCLHLVFVRRSLGSNVNKFSGFHIFKNGGFVKTTKELLGARIKELRKAKGLSQEELSEKVGIDSKHLSRIEVGTSYSSLDTLGKIAQALGIEIKDLFEFMHLSRTKDLTDNISKLLKEADEDKVRLILKIIRAVVR